MSGGTQEGAGLLRRQHGASVSPSSSTNDSPPHFVVMDKHQIAQLRAGAIAPSLDEAITAATERVQLDMQPRYIVQVISLVEIDRAPRVLISPYPDPTAEPANARRTANL